MPAGDALALAAAVGETDLPVDSEVVSELKKRQAKLDKQNDEKHDLEMELLREQIKSMKNPVQLGATSPSAPKPKNDDGSKGHSYGNRLQQKQSEHVSASGKTFQRLQKAQN
jgi:hypothetical protein